MHKLLVLYGRPEDPAHFRRHYEEVHVPLARQVPGIRAMRYSLDVADVPANGEEPGLDRGLDVFCVFEAEWDDLASMLAAFGSPEGQAVVADTANYATGGYVRAHYDV